MMYFLLILFFASLLSITFMIGRKLLMLQNGQVLNREINLPETPPFEEWKHLTIRNIKKYGYWILVTVIRLYFRSVNFLKKQYQEAKTRIKNIHFKKSHIDSEEKREVSKFLKTISDYKHKIREIKHKIKEEENSL